MGPQGSKLRVSLPKGPCPLVLEVSAGAKSGFAEAVEMFGVCPKFLGRAGGCGSGSC